MSVFVTKSYLPPLEKYVAQLERIWANGQLTNQGPLLLELEAKLKAKLEINNLCYASNGTVVLQLALKALGITKEVITTPFSYCATSNVVLWEGAKPVFVDIDHTTFCIDASLIEAAITEHTQAILATHVYGIPCDVEEIERIGKKHNIPVIYDAAHAFGAKYLGQSLLNFGDISTCSFHATKVFHTVEGGLIVTKNKEIFEVVESMRRFGHKQDEYTHVGINAKNSEFHAAMGLCVLPEVDNLIVQRKQASDFYDNHLANLPITFPYFTPLLERNYAYYPVVFEGEATLLKIKKALEDNQIFPRRYFFPSLNTLPFLENTSHCPVSEDIALRVLCLPLYPGIEASVQEKIVGIIRQNLL